MSDFIATNATAIFTLVGVALGAIATGASNYLVKSKESKLRLIEKLLDKKLQAHDEFITLISIVRQIVELDRFNDRGERLSLPIVARSKDELADFQVKYMSFLINNERWLSLRLKRECNIFLKYLQEIRTISDGVSDKQFQNMTIIPKHDFKYFSYYLEDIAHDYFNNDIAKLKFKTDRGIEHYSKWRVNRRLKSTELYKSRNSINKLLGIAE